MSLGSSSVTVPGDACPPGPLPPLPHSESRSSSAASPATRASSSGVPLRRSASGLPEQFVAPGIGEDAQGQPPRRPSQSPAEGRARQRDLAATARALAPRLLDDRLSLAEAADAVNLRDLRELRSFRNPPAVVRQVFEAVAIILSVPDSNWVRMKLLLDSGFLGRIRGFDPATSTQAQAEQLAALLRAPAFADSSLAERCPAIVGLAAWCNAVGREWAASPPTLGEAEPAPGLGGAGPSSSSWAPPRRRSNDPDVFGPPPPRPGGAGIARERNAGEMPPASARRRSTSKKLWRPDLGGLKVLPDLWMMSQAELTRVRELSISRRGVGAVTFHGLTDCREFAAPGGQLTELVALKPGEVVVYPDQAKKPPVGVGLNKPATITLYGCLPKDKGSWDEKAKEKYRNKVKQMTEAKGAELLEYDSELGVWQFRVPHF